MRHAWMPLLASAVGLAIAVPTFAADDTSSSNSASSTDLGNCKVVERKGGAKTDGSGTLSSSVTAGNGRVSGSTTGGNSVTVHSGDGQSSSSVATAGSSGGSTVVVGAGTGNCTIYVDPGSKERKK